MARDFQIPGEVMVYVKGVGELSDPEDASQAKRWELGLAEGPVMVSPRIRHRDVRVSDYGPEVPAEVLWYLADAVVSMTLIHYDPDILVACQNMAMGGSVDGTLAGTGIPLGGGVPRFSPGNLYVSLSLTSRSPVLPYRFPTAYIVGSPEYPLGTQATRVRLTWRAVPYASLYELSPQLQTSGGGFSSFNPVPTVSNGKVLWDRAVDAEDD